MAGIQSTFRGAAISVGLTLAVTLIVSGLVRLGLIEGLELEGYDLLVSSLPAEEPPAQLVIVDFDNSTVKALGTWPIPRRVLAETLEKIASGEPQLIGLDWLLTERRAPDEDKRLADILARAGNIILVNSFGTENLPPNRPLREFQERCLDVAFVNLPIDADGLIRRTFLWVRTPVFSGISLPVALVSNYLGKPLQPGGPGTYRLGDIEIPTDGTTPNTALVNFGWSKPARIIPAARLLSSNFDANVFKGKIVLIGQGSAAAKDLYATPVFRFRKPEEDRTLLSGTEIQAAAVATLLSGRTIGVLPPARLWPLNFLIIWLVISVVIKVRPGYSLAMFAVALFGTYLLAQALFSEKNVWVKFVSTETAIVLALPAGLGYRFIEERRLKSRAEAERTELMSLFERYVSPEVAAEIWKRRSEIVLAGQEKAATVLFSDIRNFTAITAGKPSAQVVAWLNDYFTAMSEVIKTNDGFLNKFIGDGMLVVFGVPLSEGVDKDACRAVQTALEMLERVDRLNAEQAPDRPRIAIGIGLHTGPLTAGNVGTRDRLEYSVIGETVNLASRLEALTKEFKTGVILSPQTHALLNEHFETRALGETLVRGFTEKIQVYTVVRENPRPEAN